MWKNIIALGLIITGVVLIIYFCRPVTPEVVYVEKYSAQKVIDSLNIVIMDLEKEKQDLQNYIDTTKAEIKIITKWYEKKRDTVITQSVDADCEFFANYLSKAAI